MQAACSSEPSSGTSPAAVRCMDHFMHRPTGQVQRLPCCGARATCSCLSVLGHVCLPQRAFRSSTSPIRVLHSPSTRLTGSARHVASADCAVLSSSCAPLCVCHERTVAASSCLESRAEKRQAVDNDINTATVITCQPADLRKLPTRCVGMHGDRENDSTAVVQSRRKTGLSAVSSAARSSGADNLQLGFGSKPGHSEAHPAGLALLSQGSAVVRPLGEHVGGAQAGGGQLHAATLCQVPCPMRIRPRCMRSAQAQAEQQGSPQPSRCWCRAGAHVVAAPTAAVAGRSKLHVRADN
jgi:hypothetical protein